MPTPEVIIDFEPDWNYPPEISYALQSVVQSTPRFVEQRRPLISAPVRSVKYDFSLSNEAAQRLINVLIYGSSKFLCVPVFSEPMLANSIVQGASSITITEDVDYMWNIQNCDYAVIIDFVNNLSEMLYVASASDTTIALSQAISGSFTASNCVIYPAFVGAVKSWDRVPVSDLISIVTVEFEETSVEHSEASGVSIDPEERICPGAYNPYNFALVYGAEPSWANHEINVYVNPESARKVGIYLDLDLVPGIPAASACFHSNNPWSADNQFYFLCDYANHTFYKIRRIPNSNGSGTVISSFSVPAVTTGGLGGYRVQGWGIQPSTGYLYVCCGAFSYHNYYRRNLIYSSPGGTLLYDSGNLFVNVGASRYSVWGQIFFFIGAQMWEYYYTLASGWLNYWGLVLTNGSFGYTNNGTHNTFRLYKSDGNYLDMPLATLSCDGQFFYHQHNLPYNLGDEYSYKMLRINPTSMVFSGSYPGSHSFSVPYGGYEIIRTAGLVDNLWYFPGQWSSNTNLFSG